ncbi:MAG: chromosome partitioning protein ParB [Treponema sp.]|nr:MAG: chromosome partitioning protein ParB [Treponema sp.]
MAKSKQKLGRGLDALLSQDDSPGKDNSSKVESSNENLILIDPNQLKPNPHQPRQVFSDESLQELSVSIKEHGIIQPVVVSRGEKGELFIVAGERRTRASILAGLSEIPVLISDIAEEKNLEVALIENIQREDLNPIEEAKAYQNLINMYDLSQEDLSQRVGKSRSAIANFLRLLQLPEYAQKAIEESRISSGHARAILSVNTDIKRKTLFEKIINEGLSVRSSERIASELNSKKNNSNASFAGKVQFKQMLPELQDLQQQFIDALGTKVIIKGNADKGTVEISYFSADDLDELYNKIKQ